MTEKQLIEYLVKNSKFLSFEEIFTEEIEKEILACMSIGENSFECSDTTKATILKEYFKSDIELKKFINKLMIQYFNHLFYKHKDRAIDLSVDDLSFSYLMEKFIFRQNDLKTFFYNKFKVDKSKIYSDIKTVINFKEQILSFDKRKIQPIKTNYLYDYFYKNKDTKNLKRKIEHDIETHKTLSFSNCNFTNKKYYKVLNNFDEIYFEESCKFNKVNSKNLIQDDSENPKIKLEFNKCEFEGRFGHIFCKSIIFKKCEIGEYYHSNIKEEKESVPYLLFMDSKIDTLNLTGLVLKEQLFKNTNDMEDEYKHIKLLKLERCEVKKSFRISIENREEKKDSKRFKIDRLDLSHTDFIPNKEEKTKAKVKIQFCDINEAVFYNTSFHDLADFYRTKFIKSVKFERADFMNISVFSEAEFDCDVDFKYVKFFGKTIFRDTIISKGNQLNLRDTIFNDEANFLDITSEKKKQNGKSEFIGEVRDIQVANRETARIIKNFYDSSNNVIEANRFYKLEMLKREEELEKIKKNNEVTKVEKQKNLFEWLVFKIHGLSSNHSQNWVLALFWILIFGLGTAFVDFYLLEDQQNSFVNVGFWSISFTIVISLLVFTRKINKWWKLFWFYILYSFQTSDMFLNGVLKVINPFQKIGQDMNILDFISKVIIAYLIYQFIISIRQNTRRK